MIQLTESAISEVLRLQSRRPAAPAFLRLGVQPLGCLGFAYDLTFEPVVHPTDHLYTIGTVQVAVDAASLPYLMGLRMDYSEDLMGGSFRFDNPNASQQCGCGMSFALKSNPLKSHP